MKVILIKDLKGKGKIHDTIEVANGYANNLIRTGVAIPDDDKNRAMVRQSIESAKIKEMERMAVANDIAEKISNTYRNFEYCNLLSPKGTLVSGFTKKAMQVDLENHGFKNVRVLPFDPLNNIGNYDINLLVDDRVKVTIQIKISKCS